MALRPRLFRATAPDDERRARLRLDALLPWAPPAAPAAPDMTDAQAPPVGSAAVASRVRLDVRAAAMLGVLALLGAVLGGWLLWRARPQAAALPTPAVATVAAAGAVDPVVAPAGPAPELVVDVQGAVRRPGVVRLPAGSRVLDALAAAGGPRPGMSTLGVNLARLLADGEQVVLAPPGSPVASAVSAGGGGAGGAPLPVDLNLATVADLDGLPGVGPVLAQRILDCRAEIGRFSSIEELQEVPGIGPAKFASLRARVRV